MSASLSVMIKSGPRSFPETILADRRITQACEDDSSGTRWKNDAHAKENDEEHCQDGN